MDHPRSPERHRPLPPPFLAFRLDLRRMARLLQPEQGVTAGIAPQDAGGPMRGRSIVVCSLLVVGCTASASVVSAAHPQERHGFWISLGIGAGSAQVTCDGCEGGRETDFVAHIALGGTLNDHFLLGADTNFWSKEKEGVTVNLYNALATVTFYPVASSGFFLKAGAGLSFADNDLRNGSTTVTVDFGNGLGLIAGAGYDLRIGRNTSITPAVSFWYGRHGDVKLGGETVFGNWKHNVVDFTVGITFH